jgi:manganese/zinc/iron transport system substrate-binding protein
MRSRRCLAPAALGPLFLALLFIWPGCGKPPQETVHKSRSSKIRATCTTTMVTDMVREVGGERVEVWGMMGPGVDPHLYKASATDVQKLQEADVIFYSGLLLEGKMQDVFGKLARTKKYVYAVTESLPHELLLEPAQMAGHTDPHVWFDVSLWARCIEIVVQGLSEKDPAGRALYEERGGALSKKMAALHQWALAKAAELPKEKRILVTSHDAYNYFGRAYGFKVVGLQGISTVEEVSLAAMAKLVQFIKEKQIKAIFVESSVPHNAIQRISEDSGVKVGGELFSDAMGTPGKLEDGYDLGSYEGMVKHNLTTMVDALK